MTSKGASNRYGNRSSKPTEHTGFAWAKDFNKSTADKHFAEHGSEFGAATIKEYVVRAVRFANMVDRVNNKSFVDNRGSTHKFNVKSNEYVVVDREGYVITYYHLKNGVERYQTEASEKKKKKKGKNNG